MSERSITITEKDGIYQLSDSTFNKFELLGLLEQIIFDLKRAAGDKSIELPSPPSPEIAVQETPPSPPPAEEKAAEPVAPPAETPEEPQAEAGEKSAAVASAIAPELRTRIGNAVKAIRDLGGEIENVDLRNMSDDELQSELEALTNQYKRLKASQKKK